MQSPWSIPVRIEDVSETGRHFELSADEQTRAAVAKLAGLRALDRLTATFDVTRYGRSGLHVTGDVMATVGQNCVVTLAPVESEVTEPIDLVFSPDAPAEASHKDADGNLILDLDSDAPEPLIGGAVDLGAIATEFLMLGIDPYPRAPGAVFEPPAADDRGGGPFAALAALKRKDRES
jgi:hypothetical protein